MTSSKDDKRFEAWKKRASAYAERHLSISDLWDAGDPYDLADLAGASFATGVTPTAFVRDVFAEDFASQAYDKELARESARSGR